MSYSSESLKPTFLSGELSTNFSLHYCKFKWHKLHFAEINQRFNFLRSGFGRRVLWSDGWRRWWWMWNICSTNHTTKLEATWPNHVGARMVRLLPQSRLVNLSEPDWDSLGCANRRDIRCCYPVHHSVQQIRLFPSWRDELFDGYRTGSKSSFDHGKSIFNQNAL